MSLPGIDRVQTVLEEHAVYVIDSNVPVLTVPLLLHLWEHERDNRVRRRVALAVVNTVRNWPTL